ncbi:MAG TPA: hypothetical protein VMZ33_04965 [Candidatus Limnocylindrales bacterium]|nr:hypothetical protein [Candidatus Limnocylindrales bacterium]
MNASRWWATKIRQTMRYVFGRTRPAERDALRSWLTVAQLELFDSMHRADQRHGLDVVESLRRSGHAEPDLLIAGLLHDAGKGRDLHLWHRIGWSISYRHRALEPIIGRLPTFGKAFKVQRAHADVSAELAVAAGCSERTADLIRHQSEPTDLELGTALMLADEAS